MTNIVDELTLFYEEINYETPKLLYGTSYLDKTIYHDSDILKNIGIENYTILKYKYPNMYTTFKECLKYKSYDFITPMLTFEGDPQKVKSDIIKTIHYKRYFSVNSYIVFDGEKYCYSPTECNENESIFIIFCIIMVTLLTISFFILIYSEKNKKILNCYKGETKGKEITICDR